MTGDPADIEGIAVSGGVTGLEVQVDDLVRAARVLAEVGGETAAVAAAAGTVAATLAPGPCALLDPAGAARATAAVLAAVAGPSGVAAAAVALEVRAGQLIVTAARYTAADRLEGEVRDLRRFAQGSLAVLALPALPLVGAAGAGWAVGTWAQGGDPLREAEHWLATHPGVVDEVVGSAPGAVHGLLGGLLGPAAGPADAALRAVTGRGLLPRDLAESAGLLALLYPPATAEVEHLDTQAGAAPVGLGGLVRGLSTTSSATAGEQQGTIAVHKLVTRLPDGSTEVRWVVDLPGTKSWQFDPRSRPHVNDLASNLELMSGEPTVRVEAVREALTQAQVGADEPVLLVGHSQGGLLAARAAGDLQGQYRISHVVTVGSPTARLDIPSSVQVLSLENRQDVVPRLDAAPNPDREHHVTVSFDAPSPTLMGEHDIGTAYEPAARALDDRHDPAVRAWLRTADGFLLDRDEVRDGAVVEATRSTYTVRNGTPP